MNKAELDALYPLPDGYSWCFHISSRIPFAIEKEECGEDAGWYCVWYNTITHTVVCHPLHDAHQHDFCDATIEEAPAIIWAKFMFDFIT